MGFITVLIVNSHLILFPASALTITIDGNPSDWLGEGPASGTSDRIAGQFIYSDFSGDDVGYGPLIYPEGVPDGCADILEFRVTTDTTNMYLLVKMRAISDQTKIVVHILSDALPDYASKEEGTWTWTTGGNEGNIPFWPGIGVGVTIADPFGLLTTREENTVYYELATDTNDPEMIQVAANKNFNAFEVSLELDRIEELIGLENGAINAGTTLYFLALAYRIDAPIEFGAHEVNEADVEDEAEKSLVTAWEDPDIYDMIGYNTKEDQISALAEWAPGGQSRTVHFPKDSQAWLEVEFPLPIPPTTIGIQPNFSIDEINPNSSFILQVTVINSGAKAWDVKMAYSIPSSFNIISGSLVPGAVDEELTTNETTFYSLDNEFDVFESRSYSLKLQAPRAVENYYINFTFQFQTLNETESGEEELIEVTSQASILMQVVNPTVYGGGYPLVNNETAALIVLLGIPVVLAIIRLFSQLLATRKGGV
jgi:hypothetical protein